MQIDPLNDRVVVVRLDAEEVTPGGLLIPETGKEKPQQGMVIAVGPGTYQNGHLVPVNLMVGDKVIFGKYSGTDVVLDNETLLILREEDIFGRLR